MDLITVRALKFDLRQHFEWSAPIIVDNPDTIVTIARPGTRCIHHTKALEIELEHFSIGVFRPGLWWNAMLDYDERGNPLLVYCNVAMPLSRMEGSLQWIDLDLDVICPPGGVPMLADESEFERFSDQFAYPDDVIGRARLTAEELVERADRREFPFAFPAIEDLLTDLGASPSIIERFR